MHHEPPVQSESCWQPVKLQPEAQRRLPSASVNNSQLLCAQRSPSTQIRGMVVVVVVGTVVVLVVLDVVVISVEVVTVVVTETVVVLILRSVDVVVIVVVDLVVVDVVEGRQFSGGTGLTCSSPRLQAVRALRTPEDVLQRTILVAAVWCPVHFSRSANRPDGDTQMNAASIL